jgi:hypothetical protein
LSKKEHIKAIDQTIQYSKDQFDSSILFISSGALGISFAFIKDVIPNLKEAVSKDYLISSWIIFSSVIFISLIGHYISILANNWAYTNASLSTEKFNKKIKKWNIPIRILNITTIIAILIGTLTLIYFINKNI